MGKNKGEMKYHTLKESLKNDILSGVYQPGDKMPSENQLVQEYDLSRHTVRKALSILEEEGYIIAVHGKGIVLYRTGTSLKRNQRTLQWLQPIFLIIYSLD